MNFLRRGIAFLQVSLAILAGKIQFLLCRKIRYAVYRCTVFDMSDIDAVSIVACNIAAGIVEWIRFETFLSFQSNLIVFWNSFFRNYYRNFRIIFFEPGGYNIMRFLVCQTDRRSIGFGMPLFAVFIFDNGLLHRLDCISRLFGDTGENG